MSPEDGERYLDLPAAATGVWIRQGGQHSGTGRTEPATLAPRSLAGCSWVADETRLLGFDGAAWVDAAVHSLNPAPLVGVNTTPTRPIGWRSRAPASLFDEEAGDHRLKINKAMR